MYQKLIDRTLFQSVKLLVQDPEVHFLFCDYLRHVVIYKQFFFFPVPASRIADLENAKEELMISRYILRLHLKLYSKLRSQGVFIRKLTRLPVSEIEKLLDIFDTTR
ncbi:hypothetical protein [Xanthocytophaga flava]|uniref:hypothetical protein n=1 Tax=Xanthocytophaga flava TaxID=3048013 RepID=UPI0028D4310A|nr:hypothetical protein [Xanthocytophaga flavus]MDJ1469569.1 hypothetical protein [Xanthocytophaga flavus]